MRSTLMLFLVAVVPNLFGQDSAVAFEKGIRPFLAKYCVSCHGPDKQKAKLRLDTLDADLLNGSEADMWQEVLDLINVSEMPPEEAKLQPTPQERQTAVALLTAEFRKVLEARRSTGGRNVLRRLTAYEYNNTLRDLLGLDLRFATDLPPEGAAKEGSKTTARCWGPQHCTLNTSSALPAAPWGGFCWRQKKSRRRTWCGLSRNGRSKNTGYQETQQSEPGQGGGGSYNLQPLVGGKPQFKGLFKLDFGEVLPDGTGVLLTGNRPADPVNAPFAADRKIGGALGAGRSGYQPEFRAEIYEIPHDAPVRVKIHAAAIPGKGNTFPRLSFELGSFRGNGVSDQKEGGNIEVRSQELQTYEFIVHGANFPFQSNKPSRPSYFRIFNEFRRGTSDWA